MLSFRLSDFLLVCLGGVSAADLQQRSGILFLNANSEGSQELSILRRQAENGFLMQLSIELLAMDEISLTPLVETDGHFQDEEKIIS